MGADGEIGPCPGLPGAPPLLPGGPEALSRMSLSPELCLPPPTWLHTQRVLPGDTAPLMPGFGPRGSTAPQIARPEASASQPAARRGPCLGLQHPARHDLSGPPAPAAASLLCCWQRLAGVGGARLCTSCQLPAKYPWGLLREGLVLIFSRGSNSTPVTRISASSSLGA